MQLCWHFARILASFGERSKPKKERSHGYGSNCNRPSTSKTAIPEFIKDSPKKLLIGGKWVPAKSGKTFETINPATEAVLCQIAEGDKADIDEAVKAARAAFEAGKWSAMGPHERGRMLLKVADLIDKYADELAMLESLDNGKPVTQAKNIDVRGAAGAFRYFAGWPTKIYGETNPSDPRCSTTRCASRWAYAASSCRGTSRC